MPGPIATAFVDIIARLKLEDVGSNLEREIAKQVSASERQFNKLEGVSAAASRRIQEQFSRIQLNVETRQAVEGVARIDAKVREATASLRELSGRSVSVDTAAFNAQIERLGRSFREFQAEFKQTDGQSLTIDVGEAQVRLGEVSTRAKELIRTVTQLGRSEVGLDVVPALASLKSVTTQVNETARRLREIGDGTVRVNVEDLQLKSLQEQLLKVNQDINRVDRTIHVRVDESGISSLHRVSEESERADKSLGRVSGTFERVGTRLLAFAAFGGVTAGLSQLVSAGVQAAAQIETIEVALQRVFQGFAQAGKDLGGTSNEFLKNLRELAITTPFQFVDLGNISIKLTQVQTNLDKVAGAAGGIKAPSEIAVDRMRAIADAGAQVGATADQLEGVVNALAKISSKGKITAIDLNQISTRLPNFQRTLQISSIIDELNRLHPGLNATTADFDKLRKDGAIPVGAAIDGLVQGMRNIPGAAGAAAAQAQTLTGALSNLKDAVTFQFSDAFASVGQQIAEQINAGFAKADVTTPLEDAVNRVIGAAGVATEGVLPDLLDFATRISEVIAEAVTAVGKLLGSLAGGFGGDFASGLVQSLTGVLNLLTEINSILSLLPRGFGEFVGEFVTLGTLGKKLGVDLFAPIGAALQEAGTAVKAFVAGAAVDFAALGRSIATALGVLAAVFAVQELLNGFAEADRRATEFKESVNAAAASLKSFDTTGDAVLDFLKKFDDASHAIKTGNLIEGLTSSDVATSLGLTEKQLASLVRAAAEAGSIGAVDLGRFGISAQNMSNEVKVALINVEALAKQQAKGAAQALRAAVATDRFGAGVHDQAVAILNSATATGDYFAGLQKLEGAANVFNRTQFESLAAVNKLSGAQRAALISQATTTDEAGRKTVNYTAALASLRKMLNDLDDAYVGAIAKTVKFGDKTNTIGDFVGNLTDRFGSARTDLVDFARAVDQANLSATDLEAISNRIGSSLSGEELSAALKQIAADFTSTLSQIESSLPPFADAVQQTFKDAKIPPDAIGLDAVQAAFDNFSLDKFINELNKIVEARGKLIENLQTLAGASTEAVRDLLSLKLDPTQLAVATQALVDELGKKGLEGLNAFLTPFQVNDALIAGAGTDLTKTLVEAGIDPALQDAIPGLTSTIQRVMHDAGISVDASGPGSQVGSEFAGGVLAGISGGPGGSLNTSVAGLLSQQLVGGPLPQTASGAGNAIGQALALGIGTGISENQQAVNAAATAAVLEAKAAAEKIGRIFSPSKLFAEIGKNLALGMAQGIESGRSDVAGAAAGLVGNATRSVPSLGGSPSQQLAGGLAPVFNVLIARINDAFRLLAARLGVGGVFAGAPVRGFATGLVATGPTRGVFGDRGLEALIPLGDGAAAANVLRQIAPLLPQQGREAAARAMSALPPAGGQAAQQVVHNHVHNWNISAPTDDPEALALRLAARMERRFR